MQITIYGRDDCEDTEATCHYLTAQGIPFEYVDIDHEADANQFVLFINKGMRITPTVILENHHRKLIITEPSDAEMQAALEAMA